MSTNTTNLQLTKQAGSEYSIDVVNANLDKIDAGCVNVTGNQTISGQKTWSGLGQFNGNLRITNQYCTEYLRNTVVDITSPPAYSLESHDIVFEDKNGTTIGRMRFWVGSAGQTVLQLETRDNNGNNRYISLSDAVDKSNAQTITGTKTFTDVVTVAKNDGTSRCRCVNTSLIRGTLPSADTVSGGFSTLNNNQDTLMGLNHTIMTSGAGRSNWFVRDYANSNYKEVALFSGGYLVAPNRTYNASNTSDVVTIGSLQSSTDIVHTTGNETVGGVKTFTSLMKGRFDKDVYTRASNYTLLYKRTASRQQWWFGFGGHTMIIANVQSDSKINTRVISLTDRPYSQPIMMVCTDSKGVVTVWGKGQYSAAVQWHLMSNMLYGTDYADGVEIIGTEYSSAPTVGGTTQYDSDATYTSVVNSTDFDYTR